MNVKISAHDDWTIILDRETLKSRQQCWRGRGVCAIESLVKTGKRSDGESDWKKRDKAREVSV